VKLGESKPAEIVEGACLAQRASCVCTEAPNHESPHLCSCGGSWEDRFGEFEVYANPGSAWGWEWDDD
jgi:hypothetical protein